MRDLRPGRDAARDRSAVRADMGDGAGRGEADGTRLHRLLNQVRHAREVVLIGLPVERPVSHRVHPKRRVAEVSGVVDALGERLDGVQIFRKGLPAPVDAGDHRILGDVLDRLQALGEPLSRLRLAGCERKAAVAHHDRGHPVPARAASERIPRHLGIHVSVAVDEARRNDHALGIDHFGGGVPDPSDLGDPSGADADIRPIPRHAGTIDHRAVPDKEIECHRALPPRLFRGQAPYQPPEVATMRPGVAGRRPRSGRRVRACRAPSRCAASSTLAIPGGAELLSCPAYSCGTKRSGSQAWTDSRRL